VKATLAQHVRYQALAAVLNVLALVGWTGGIYACVVFVTFFVRAAAPPPVAPFLVVAVAVMSVWNTFWRGPELLAAAQRRAALRQLAQMRGERA